MTTPTRKVPANQLASEYNEGMPISALAKKYNIHRTAIYAALKEAGYNAGLPHSDPRRKISVEDEEYICDLYEQGSVMKELSEDFHVTIQTINKILIRNNVSKRKPGMLGYRKDFDGKFKKL